MFPSEDRTTYIESLQLVQTSSQSANPSNKTNQKSPEFIAANNAVYKKRVEAMTRNKVSDTIDLKQHTDACGARFPKQVNDARKGIINRVLRCVNDSQRSMLQGIPRSAICVQNFDDSLSFAIRITYRISLRSSSLREPRHPSLKVVHC